MTDRDGCIVLNMIPGIGYARYQLLVEAFGSPAAALAQSRQSLEKLRGIGATLADNIAGHVQKINLADELALAEQAGVRITTLFDDDYPELLRGIHDPPLCLYVRGSLPPDWDRAVAIVGSRRMSAYGRQCTQALAEQAVQAGWLVISGLAFGVDAAAHLRTLEAGGITVAVLGGGLARVHPQEHVPLARRIVENGGAVISEFPMLFPVSRQSFPRRNRIVSGLSRAVLVVEAGLDSGALITARIANEQGKPLFAVPGHIDNPQALGCHRLIKEGARLLDHFTDILEDLNLQPDLFDQPPPSAGASPFPAGSPDGTKQKILTFLRDSGTSNFDQLVIGCELDSALLLPLLIELEMSGLVVQLPGRYYSIRKSN